MPRHYNVLFKGVAVSAPQDLVNVTGAAGKVLRILRQWWGCTDTTAPTDQQLQIESQFLPAVVTAGTGGAVATPQKVDPGDAAASFTARINDTTGATTSGAAAQLEENGSNVKAGYDFMFPKPPVIGPSEAFTFHLVSTVVGTVHLSGGVLIEEIGG